MSDCTPPPAPKDCVYGPWWDGVISRWLAITPTPSGAPHYWAHQWTGSDWCPYSSSERELLRLAKELEQKDARIKELEKELEWRVRADEK